MNKPILKIRVTIPHVKSCRAIQNVEDGTWNHPWGVATHVFRTYAGRKPGNHSFIRFGCNISECHAEKLVPLDMVALLS